MPYRQADLQVPAETESGSAVTQIEFLSQRAIASPRSGAGDRPLVFGLKALTMLGTRWSTGTALQAGAALAARQAAPGNRRENHAPEAR